MFEVYRPLGILEVRSWLPERGNGARPVTMDGRELPGDVGATLPGVIRVLCVAPGEWLLVSSDQSATDICKRIGVSLREQDAVVLDATDGLGVLSVHGPKARDLLSKGCGLDFYPRIFPVGRCARTRFAQTSMLIDHFGEAPTFHCYVARSHLRFMADWLEDAAMEFESEPG